jgi:hypothetical protein
MKFVRVPGAGTADGVLPLSQFLKNKSGRLWGNQGKIVMYSTYGITLGGLILKKDPARPMRNMY